MRRPAPRLRQRRVTGKCDANHRAIAPFSLARGTFDSAHELSVSRQVTRKALLLGTGDFVDPSRPMPHERRLDRSSLVLPLAAYLHAVQGATEFAVACRLDSPPYTDRVRCACAKWCSLSGSMQR